MCIMACPPQQQQYAFVSRNESPPTMLLFGGDMDAYQHSGHHEETHDHFLRHQHQHHQQTNPNYYHAHMYEQMAAGEEYRNPSPYAYYAPCPAPYGAGAEGNAELHMRINISATSPYVVQRPFNYDTVSDQHQPHAQQHITFSQCNSVGLPLTTSDAWSGAKPARLQLEADIAQSYDWSTVSGQQLERRQQQERELDEDAEPGVKRLHPGHLTKLKAAARKLKTKSALEDLASEHGQSMVKFQCFLCAKQYCRRSTLKAHLRQHSGEKPYFCTICGKSFSQAANLTAHKRIHTGEKPFACPICCRPFSQSSSLVTHKRTHTGERPYQCPRCEKAFTDSSTLTKHVRTHTGHKPYQCQICLLSFSQSGNLNRHMKTHVKHQQLNQPNVL